MKTERKINIGITVSLNDYSKTLFGNGIIQNVFILRDLYKKCRNIENAYIVNIATPKQTNNINSEIEPYLKNIISLQDSLDKCDLIVCGQGYLSPSVCNTLKNNGKKIVIHIMGPELSIFTETILFKDKTEAKNIYTRNSDSMNSVWISPHYYKRDKCFFETLYDTDVNVAPYVWDPRFIQNHINQLLKQNNIYTGLYVPNKKIEKRICSMEPNINMIKTSMVPIMINEHLYKKYPESIERSVLFATNHISMKPDLVNFVKNLDIYKAKKMFFEGRYPIVWTLQANTDILLGHQNQNELNYLYLDAAWMGYPVVHNSPMMKDLGWYYEENDIHMAVEHLNYIAKNFDDNEYQNEEYLKKSKQYIYRYMIDNPENIRGYERLIDKVMNSKI